jgi:uncharacterized protein
VEILLNHGANINSKTQSGCTALHKASEKGHQKVVETLLNHGADVNIQDESGQKALDVALKNTRHKIVEILERHTRLAESTN